MSVSGNHKRGNAVLQQECSYVLDNLLNVFAVFWNKTSLNAEKIILLHKIVIETQTTVKSLQPKNSKLQSKETKTI